MKITLISDLHGHYPELPGGDLLIIAGDLTANNSLAEINRLKDWMLVIGANLYEKTVFIAGNHDNWIQNRCFFNDDKNCWESPFNSYLEDSCTEFRGLKIWGSPWTRSFKGMNPNCKAFVVDHESELKAKWAAIPDDTDILVTHSPAWGFGDRVYRQDMDSMGNDANFYENVGSKSLLKWVADHSETLKLHVCGHIHEGYAIWDPRKLKKECQDTNLSPILINASHVNEHYNPVNKPITIEI